jgi:hypothetical protein
METSYYADGSVYAMKSGEPVEKKSFKAFSPAGGRRLNINVDMGGDRVFVRNAKVSDLIMPADKLHRVMPKRTNTHTLIEDLGKMTGSVESDRPNNKNKNKNKKQNKDKNKKRTHKRIRAPKKSPRSKSSGEGKKKEEDGKSKSNSRKRAKKSNRTRRSRPNPSSAAALVRASLFSDTIL